MIRALALALGLLMSAGSAGWWFWTREAPPTEVREAGEVERLAARLGLLEEDLRAANDRLERLERTLAALQGEAPDPDLAPPDASGFGGFDELMLLADRRDINAGLTPVRIGQLTEIFGAPAPALDDQCAEPTSPRLLETLEAREVGPFRVRMLRPALDSLERVLTKVRDAEPDLYRQMRTYGAFCVRLIRGTTDSISRHAFGLAIDVSIGGTLDAMGDGRTQFGLVLLNDYFYEEGWIWGAGFGREDSMHFEVSAELLQKWLDEGLL